MEAYFPKWMWKYRPNHGEDKSLHERMAVRRIRTCIWKQWKLTKTRKRKLVSMGVDSHYAATIAYDRKGYWFNAENKASIEH